MRWILARSIVSLLVGCASDDAPSSSDTEGSSTGPGTSSGTTPTTVDDTGASMTSTSGATTDDGGSGGSGPGAEGSSSGDGPGDTSSDGDSESGTAGPTGGGSSSDMDGGTDTGGESTSDGGGALPDGSACSDSSECASTHCYVIPILGGICGECESDADCPDGGCSLPSPLTGAPSACNDGSLGGGCETDAVCMPQLECVTVISIPGVVVANTCSECETDLDCGGQLCAPTYDVAALGGSWSCVDAGSVPDGGGCDLNGSGDQQCASGACGIADVMGILQLGICGECEDDLDCAPGQTCAPAEIDLVLGATGATCV